ncbi:hypothetical protein INR49_021097, partial [Caranx melampygus]
MEHPGPAGGAAESLPGAGLPAQRNSGQPAPHRSPGTSPEPAAGASGPAARHLQTQPAPAQRSEQCRVSAAGKGLVCEHQLDAGRRTGGGGQHRHGTETGLGDAVASLQTRPVHALEQTVPQ